MTQALTFDGAIDAFASETDLDPLDALQWLLDHWDAAGPRCRASLAAYVAGADMSERTERALFYIVLALGEKADTAAFPGLCRLVEHADQSDLVLGDDGSATFPAILISTFDGDTAPLEQVIESGLADDVIRGETLMALAYLVRTRRVPEVWMQAYLAGLPDRVQDTAKDYLWYDWARAVAGLGFAGLAGAVEAMMQRGVTDPTLYSAENFWDDLRETQADPGGMTSRAWEGVGPLLDAVGELRSWDYADGVPEPIAPPMVNPLRHFGRNDPCPCGSGRKFKKCCLP